MNSENFLGILVLLFFLNSLPIIPYIIHPTDRYYEYTLYGVYLFVAMLIRIFWILIQLAKGINSKIFSFIMTLVGLLFYWIALPNFIFTKITITLFVIEFLFLYSVVSRNRINGQLVLQNSSINLLSKQMNLKKNEKSQKRTIRNYDFEIIIGTLSMIYTILVLLIPKLARGIVGLVIFVPLLSTRYLWFLKNKENMGKNVKIYNMVMIGFGFILFHEFEKLATGFGVFVFMFELVFHTIHYIVREINNRNSDIIDDTEMREDEIKFKEVSYNKTVIGDSNQKIHIKHFKNPENVNEAKRYENIKGKIRSNDKKRKNNIDQLKRSSDNLVKSRSELVKIRRSIQSFNRNTRENGLNIDENNDTYKSDTCVICYQTLKNTTYGTFHCCKYPIHIRHLENGKKTVNCYFCNYASEFKILLNS